MRSRTFKTKMASDDEEVLKTDKSPLPMCKYGDKCYRRNVQHLQQYRHPKRKHEDDEATPEKKAKKDVSEEEDLSDPNNEQVIEPEKSPSIEEIKNNKEVEKEESENSSSEEEDDEASPESPLDVKQNIKQKFLVQMPDDFYEFWDFCKSISSKNPTDALKDLLGFSLVGPYLVLAGLHKERPLCNKGRPPSYLTFWRYYYDPPEFLTVIRGDDKSQHHLGYYRDDPNKMPVFVASNSAQVNGTLTSRGENIFAAVNFYISDSLKEKSIEKSLKDKLKELQKNLTDWAMKKDFPLDQKTLTMKARDKKVVCKTFHGAGIVVPVDDNDVGYRPVPESPGDLKKILKKIKESKNQAEKDKYFEPLQELITLVQFANDECDYGEGLELGLDLFTFGGDCFHRPIQHLLSLAYQLLGRHQFSDIITAHIKNRSSQMSDISS